MLCLGLISMWSTLCDPDPILILMMGSCVYFHNLLLRIPPYVDTVHVDIQITS